jgi:ferritin-like metal-binding protein YciE
MKEVATLNGLMVRHLQSIFEAENSWSQAMATNANLVSDRELKRSFEKSGEIAMQHATVIQNLLRELGATSLDRRNAVADDLVRELRDVQEIAADREVQDAGMLVTHQCMNHYLIAKYGTVASYAHLLQKKEVASVLHKMMEDEKKEDKNLTKLAEKKVNEKARTALIL